MRNVADTKRLILTAAKFSAAAYAFSDDIPSHYRCVIEANFSDITVHRHGHVSCTIAVDRDNLPPTVWIGFDGSKEWEDWKDNFDQALVPLAPGQNKGNVHVGFARQFAALRSSIDSSLSRLDSTIGLSQTELVFTGHSLGSATATLAAVHYSMLGYQTRSIGFATPRLFDRTASYYVDHICQSIITRVEQPTDWVCDVPIRRGRNPYSHVGKGLWVDSEGGVTTEDRPLHHKFAMVLKRLTRRMFAWRIHRMEEYIRRLEKWNEGDN